MEQQSATRSAMGEPGRLSLATTLPVSGSRRERYVHVALPFVLMMSLVVTHSISPSFYKTLVIEDGAVEYATAGVYFIGFICGLVLARRLYAKRSFAWALLYACLSSGFLFVALEEISWGQRIFQLGTPEFIEERNIQGEIGLHNLSSFRLLLHPAYIAVGFAGAFGSLILSRLRVPIPIVARLLPPPHLFLYFVPCCLFYLTAEIISPFTTIRYGGELSVQYGGRLEDPRGILAAPAYVLDLVRDLVLMGGGTGGQNFSFWRHQEPVELLLSLGFLFFVTSRLGKE
jgi:hypothetical protein